MYAIRVHYHMSHHGKEKGAIKASFYHDTNLVICAGKWKINANLVADINALFMGLSFMSKDFI